MRHEPFNDTIRDPKGVPKPGCGAEWLDMLGTGEKLLCAGLRHQIGPDGDLRAAYRLWYEEQMREHDEVLFVPASGYMRPSRRGAMPPKAVLDSLRLVWLALQSLKIPAAVMGGLALTTWKRARFT